MKTRPNGWPLCPRCGADELACLRGDGQPACVCAEMFCYRCAWRGDPRAPLLHDVRSKVWAQWQGKTYRLDGDA